MSRSDLHQRSTELEILDGPGIADAVRAHCYRQLAVTHKWLGNTGAVLTRLRQDPYPVRTVLDIGCGHGALAIELQQKLGVRAIGIDLAPPAQAQLIPIICADAVRDRLPDADVAVAVVMVHHLTPAELTALIRNVGRSCRRFVILDLVRHWLPLALFRCFVSPFVNPINVADGIRSIERSFSPHELTTIVRMALEGTSAQFRHSVAPCYVRQVIDITYDMIRIS